MAGPVGPLALHPAAYQLPVGIQTIPLTLGADVDLTQPTASGGQTNGYCARAILIGSTGGNLTYYDGTGAGPFTQALTANQRFDQTVSYVVNSSTTVTTVSAML